MHKISKLAVVLGVAGLFAAGSAVTASAQTRLQNANTNRDYRNVQLKRSATSTEVRGTTTPRVMPVQAMLRARANGIVVAPNWINATNSPLRNMKEGSSTRGMPELFARLASSTELKGHEGWKEARIDKFAALQANLISQLRHSLEILKDSRTKIGLRIATAEQSGRNMIEAKRLLLVADGKIADAEKAIRDVAAYVPPAVASSTKPVSDKASIKLEKPREIGSAAIEALKAAKKALNDTVVEAARSMGLRTGDRKPGNATTTPPVTTTPAATTTATSTTN